MCSNSSFQRVTNNHTLFGYSTGCHLRARDMTFPKHVTLISILFLGRVVYLIRSVSPIGGGSTPIEEDMSYMYTRD